MLSLSLILCVCRSVKRFGMEVKMNITYNQENRVFKLDTPNSSYLMGIVDKEGFLGHIYYGKRLEEDGVAYLMRTQEAPFVPEVNDRERGSFMDSFPMEYPTHGTGDYRQDCLSVRTKDGYNAVQLTYVSHQIYDGKKKLEGLPATFGEETECKTLEIRMEDPILSLEAVLSYSVFADTDAIAGSVRIINHSQEPVWLTKALSGALNLDEGAYDVITLHGGWARERHIVRRPLEAGVAAVYSRRGESGHQEQPFMALCEKTATQETGAVYGMHFVYSGNHLEAAEKNQFFRVRAVMGIYPEDFSWKLLPEESFQTPEMIRVFSCEGLDGMTRAFHTLYRNHLMRGKWLHRKRPILINNWEATYFDFDEQKLLDIAKQASALGIEMLVMDDGWFGNRSSDNMALGDWQVNEQKLKGGLKKLVDEVNALGMQFGIWFEPEMISPDSDLYRAHPDWAIQIPGRRAGLIRNQYVLDISRPEVADYIYECVAKVLRSANIAYVKWDMNRPLSDLGSAALDADRQGELSHRYTLAVYRMQERLITEFPDLLLENCSSGGARFDPGMLYYSPQIWCSDDTDAIERLAIQEGTALLYPLSCMGAHVSDCPNHTVGRTAPFETRGYVALAGTFGYELDVTRIPEADRNSIPGQVRLYHKYNDLVREGEYYRLASYSENRLYDCWEVVSSDKTEALVTYIQVLNVPNRKSRRICLKGLDPQKRYLVEVESPDGEGDAKTAGCFPQGSVLLGSTLMNAGILMESISGDYVGKLIHLTQVQ